MPALIELLGGIVPALALLGACLGWAFATGAINVWAATFGKVLQWLASILPGGFNTHLGWHFPDLAGMVRSADVAVQDYFKLWRKGAEIEIAYSIHLLKLVWQAQAEAVDWVAQETAKTFDYVIHIRMPKVVKYAVPFALTPLILRKIVSAVLPHIRLHGVKVIQTVTHTIEHTTTTIIHKAAQAGATVPPFVFRLPHRLKGLEGDVTGLRKRLGKVEGLFAAGVMAAVLANVLGVATKCLRKGNLGRAARQVCGMDSSLLNSLLQDGLAIVGVLSVVEFATELRAVEDEAVKIMGALVKEWPS